MGENSLSQDPDSPPKHADILLKEYDHRFSEMMAYSDRYHKQTDILNAAITISIAVGAYLFKDKAAQPSWSLIPFIATKPNSYSSLVIACFLMAGAILVFYLLSLSLNSLFLVYVNGARIAAIEQKLNRLSKEKLLIWDSFAVPHFFGLRFHSSSPEYWIRPTVVVAFWLVLMLISVFLGLCVLAFKYTDLWFALTYTAAVSVLLILHFLLWRKLHKVGREELREYFSRS